MRVVRIHEITSEENPSVKAWKQLLAPRGMKKQGRALLSGPKIVSEALRVLPERAETVLLGGPRMTPPEDVPEGAQIVRLPSPIFQELDTSGTHAPLLVLRLPDPEPWTPADGLPPGLTLFLPFQDPENLGAAIRSGLAFGVSRIVLLVGAAHPFHPKTLRASGGAVIRAHLAQGPTLESLPGTLPLIPLSAEGQDITRFEFPPSCGLLPGVEGPGLPAAWRERAVSIPIRPEVESLNAAAAVAIALHEWARRRGALSRGTATQGV